MESYSTWQLLTSWSVEVYISGQLSQPEACKAYHFHLLL